MNKIVNEKEIEKCLKYVEEEQREGFKQLVSSLHVTANLADYAPYFEDDGDSRNIYRITVSRNGKRISFKYGDSIANTLEGREPDLYSILSIIKSDYDFNNVDFEEFCNDFGYDTDSRKAEKTYKNYVRMNKKLHKIFDDEEIEALPQ